MSVGLATTVVCISVIYPVHNSLAIVSQHETNVSTLYCTLSCMPACMQPVIHKAAAVPNIHTELQQGSDTTSQLLLQHKC